MLLWILISRALTLDNKTIPPLAAAFRIPPEFQIRIFDKQPHPTLPALYVEMDVLQGIQEIALLPFNAPFIIGRESVPLFVYATVGIEMRPHPSSMAVFRNFHALWLLYECCVRMLTEHNIRASQCFSYWKDSPYHAVELGYAGFLKKSEGITDTFQTRDAEFSKIEEKEAEPLPSDTKPIDFSKWRDYSEPLINSSVGALPYKTLVGDFYQDINPAEMFIMVYQAVIDRASRPSRTRIPETQFHYLDQRLTINYHRRPDAGIEEMQYETVVRGLAWLPTALLRNRKFAECSFVIFKEGHPKIDGWIRKGIL
ncbi:MAG: hypothetical protein LQ351_007656 [Letrouitia transgressa]|nr:MAG: hypothetical protein LQ351_007656 [Letrouitia transgressa]